MECSYAAAYILTGIILLGFGLFVYLKNTNKTIKIVDKD